MNLFQESLQESLAHIGPFLTLPEAERFLTLIFLGSLLGGAFGTFTSALFFRETESSTRADLMKATEYGVKIGAAGGAVIGGAIFLLSKYL